MKLFFLTSEITPFTLPSILGNYSAKVSLFLQGKSHDLRTMIPKYGYISERKYILRGGSFLSPDTRLECFLRGAKFLAKNLRGAKIISKNLRGVKIFLNFS